MAGMMPCGAAMMGKPSVVGAGVDCNNYMDVRNELESTTRARFASTRIFLRGDTLTGRYSLSAETGFMPEKCHPVALGRCCPASVRTMTISRSKATSPGPTS